MLPCQPFATREQRPGARAEINEADRHSEILDIAAWKQAGQEV
jgi:hypothetical protein